MGAGIVKRHAGPESSDIFSREQTDVTDELRADPETVPVRQGYARWSETYDTQDNPLIVLEEPLMRFLLGDVQDLRVADMGCGTGRNTVYLSEAGRLRDRNRLHS